MKHNIILIDDEESTRSTIRRLDMINGLKVKWAKTPEGGLELIQKHDFKVMILDIMMPTLELKSRNIKNTHGLETGIILLEKINRLEKCKNILKIFCSARREKIIQDYGLVKGRDFHHYFQKPYNTYNLAQIIKEKLQR